MNERLKELRDELKLNQKEFSSRINISQPALAMMEKGQRTLRDIHISQIRTEFNVNEHWLRTGEGDMFAQSETFSLDEKAQKNNLTELEIDIMRGYMELPPDTRKELMTLFGSIYGKHAETAATTVDPIEAELDSYRKELEAEKKARMSSASPAQSEPS